MLRLALLAFLSLCQASVGNPAPMYLISVKLERSQKPWRTYVGEPTPMSVTPERFELSPANLKLVQEFDEQASMLFEWRDCYAELARAFFLATVPSLHDHIDESDGEECPDCVCLKIMQAVRDSEEELLSTFGSKLDDICRYYQLEVRRAREACRATDDPALICRYHTITYHAQAHVELSKELLVRYRQR